MTIYETEIISPEEKDRLFELFQERFLYTKKAEIYGCCLKLLTDIEKVKQRWEDNFYTMGENIRSHGRIVVLEKEDEGLKVKYEPMTKTAFLFNIDYYGWIKSITLAVAGDLLEDEHRIYHVHGAAIDVMGRGVSIIAPSKTGKTTHSWGLLRLKEARLVTDDWYFVRLSTKRPLAFGSEKNCYAEGDIGQIWTEYKPLVDRAKFDEKGRAVVNVRWVVGEGGVVPMTTIYTIILLKRDRSDPRIVTELTPEEGLSYLAENDFCNPHQLVRDERKMDIRRKFFRKLLEQSEVYMVNTTQTPQESQEAIRRIVLAPKA
ncbi:MAG: hypothetical protein FJ151_00395 [Euryarchaeota archaeon]|nr:hypothetical protein [Euryarchaeota archaeon]